MSPYLVAAQGPRSWWTRPCVCVCVWSVLLWGPEFLHAVSWMNVELQQSLWGGDELCNSSSLLVFCIFIFLPPGKLSAPSAIQRLRLHSFLCGCENLIQGFHWIDGSIQRFSPFVSLSSSNQKLLRIQTLCVCGSVFLYCVSEWNPFIIFQLLITLILWNPRARFLCALKLFFSPPPPLHHPVATALRWQQASSVRWLHAQRSPCSLIQSDTWSEPKPVQTPDIGSSVQTSPHIQSLAAGRASWILSSSLYWHKKKTKRKKSKFRLIQIQPSRTKKRKIALK